MKTSNSYAPAIVIATIGIFLIFGSRLRPMKALREQVTNLLTKNAQFQFGLDEEQAEAVADRIREMTAEQSQRELRRAFFAISLADFRTPKNARSDTRIRASLVTLANGLLSSDDDVRQTSNRYIESLLIDLSHGARRFQPEYEYELHRLLSLYKVKGKEQIEKMRSAFPNSPALAYLEHF